LQYLGIDLKYLRKETFMNTSNEIMSFHLRSSVVDAHGDNLSKYLKKYSYNNPLQEDPALDIQSYFTGGVNLQFLALYTPQDFIPHSTIQFTLEMIDLFYRWKKENSEVLYLITSKKDIELLEEGKLFCLLSIEGGEALDGKLFMLDLYYRLGVRAMGLTWNGRNLLADGVNSGNNPGGLTFFGEEIVKKMNTLGMIIDVSHISEKSFWDVIKLSSEPVIASHSNCFSLHKHIRNLKDEQIRAIAEKGGVIGITFVSDFLGEGVVTIEQVVNHIEHIIDITGGYDTAGIGSDFYGTDKLPEGLKDISFLPRLTESLVKRGHKYKDIEKIIGKNWLRILSQILK